MDKWWEKAIIYEIYMPSYYDSNGDGIGDFKGLTEKLDYLKELGINALWITPFYKSPKVDNGYDIEDFYSIDSDYGTLEDFKIFVDEVHKRGIKLIIDMILNHTSNKHPWFIESKVSLENSKRDWYIWKNGFNNLPPNNWESFFGGSAWEYDSKTKQYYYHAFSKEQVDLNWSNPKVKDAMFDVIKFWLDLGVDGLRLDVINFLKVNNEFKNNPIDKDGKQIHQYDKDQEGILNIIEEINNLTKKYGDIFLLGEVGSEDLGTLMSYVGENLLDAVFNFNLGSILEFDPERIYEELKKMYCNYNNKIFTLFFGNHDISRFISRFSNGYYDEEKAKLVATLILTAKGIPFIYYGEEIGMRDYYPQSVNDIRDIQAKIKYYDTLREGKSEQDALKIANKVNRDKARTPMQWNNNLNCGFSSGKPWIKITEKYRHINVEEQRRDEKSIFNYYKKIISLRNGNLVFQIGECTDLILINDIISFQRNLNNEKYLILLNFSDKLSNYFFPELKKAEFVLSSIRDKIVLDEKIELLPFEAVIVKLPY
ncbi:alpha-glucosidase [Anaerobranca gottschalkii]|uniref:Trehalose-6-phosphate hydrolase n=1 Tax=Anaerobranca gottschalkii DSM 13577 TaxID=1120990 RepID=A0A1H9YHN8_9FIRM|nr:alpha-glucosidase [Anaerobranca gottschalkii]SES68440.1 trehalose-6-phosphate hydrolase [Anaerobranca gottschalkii DSM 13577]